jgi:hypothetical protein
MKRMIHPALSKCHVAVTLEVPPTSRGQLHTQYQLRKLKTRLNVSEVAATAAFWWLMISFWMSKQVRSLLRNQPARSKLTKFTRDHALICGHDLYTASAEILSIQLPTQRNKTQPCSKNDVLELLMHISWLAKLLFSSWKNVAISLSMTNFHARARKPTSVVGQGKPLVEVSTRFCIRSF